MSKTLRVMPLGGLGEIGKNMTVVEYDGKIVVVDTGLRFPAPDQLGIDLVLPDFTYLRERQADIEAIVLTHGHEDHVGALPFVLREFDDWPPIYGGPLTIAMVRSKLDEHKLKEVPARGGAPGRGDRRRPVRGGAGQAGPLDPGHVRLRASPASWARSWPPATTSSTRPRSTASRRTSPAWPSWAARASCCCSATPPTPTGRAGRCRSRRSAPTWRRPSRAARAGSWSPRSPRTSTACSRWSTPPTRWAARSRWSGGR